MIVGAAFVVTAPGVMNRAAPVTKFGVGTPDPKNVGAPVKVVRVVVNVVGPVKVVPPAVPPLHPCL